MSLPRAPLPFRHAFILNCHNDIEQAQTTTRLLKQYFAPPSQVLLYVDGSRRAESDLAELRQSCDVVDVGDYEPDKCRGIIQAINRLMELAAQERIDVASFLHCDMIPLDRNHFDGFIRRFYESGKTLTWTALTPNSICIDFCNLHFRVRESLHLGLFPVTQVSLPQGINMNEMQLTLSFQRACPDWRTRAYTMWTIVTPFPSDFITTTPDGMRVSNVIRAHTADDQFLVNNFTPESTIIHCNDPWFWDNYDQLVRV